MKKCKKLLSALLALCMVLLLAPTTAFADGVAFNGSVYINDHLFVWNNSSTTSWEKPVYYVNGAETISTTEPESWNAMMDYTTGTLTLQNYTGGGIAVWYADNDLTVKLIGTNVISPTAYGYQGDPVHEKSWARFDVWNTKASVGKNVTITSDDAASLSIEYYVVDTEHNVALDTGNMGLVIKGKASVSVDVSAAKTGAPPNLQDNTTIPGCTGVLCSDNFQLLDQASLNVTTHVDYTGDESSTTYGVTVDQTQYGPDSTKTLEVNTTGDFKIDCDDYAVNSENNGLAVCLTAYKDGGGTLTSTLTNVGTMEFTYPAGQTALNNPRGKGVAPAVLFSDSTAGQWTVNSNTPGATTYTEGISDLTGTVTLTPNDNNTTLTATVSGSNNTGTLSYQWFKNGTAEGDASSGRSSYTINASSTPVGSVITCQVTSSVEKGALISGGFTVPKRDKQAPEAYTSLYKVGSNYLKAESGGTLGYGREWAVCTTDEAPAANSDLWTNVSLKEGLAYTHTYYVFWRYAATDTYNASPASPSLKVNTKIMPFFKVPNTTTPYQKQVVGGYTQVPISWVINPGVPDDTNVYVDVYNDTDQTWVSSTSQKAAQWRNGGYIYGSKTPGTNHYRVTVDGYGSTEFAVKWTTMALTGTVTFSTSTPRIGAQLTAYVDDTNNTGDLSYQWYYGLDENFAPQDGDPIEGATGRSYTPTEDYFDYYLCCAIGSSVQTGTDNVYGITANVVAKGSPDYFNYTPIVKVVGSDSITVENDTTLEFAAVTSYDSSSLTATDWHSGTGDTFTFTGLTGNKYYYVFARQKATDTLEASNASRSCYVKTGDEYCHDLTVSGGSGNGRFDVNVTATLRPYGSQGYKFTGWKFTNTTTGADVTDAITVTYTDSTDKSEGTISMPNYDLTATAVYSTEKTAPIEMQMQAGYRTDYLVGEELDLSNAYIEYWYDDGLGNIHYVTSLREEMLPENLTELPGKNMQKKVTYDGCDAFIYVITVTQPDGVTNLFIRDSPSKVQKGQTYIPFHHTINSSGTGYDAVTWTVSGNSSTGTTINSAGILSVASDETATTLTVTVTADKDASFSDSITVTVTDAAVYYVVTEYGVSGKYSSLQSCCVGETVTVTALDSDPEAEHTSFAKWTTYYSGFTFTDATAKTTTFTMPEKDVTVTANYLPTVQYTADSSAISGGSLTVDGKAMAGVDATFQTAYNGGSVTYQWYRVGATEDTLLADQTGVSLGLAKADVGSSYYVKVSYSSITLTSAPRTVVAADALTGSVLITRGDGDTGYIDYAVIGDTLTATLSTDSNNTGALSYQWRRVDSSSAGDIPGATGSTYTLTADDYNCAIYCYVTSSIQSEGVGAWYFWGRGVRKQAAPAAPTGITPGDVPTYPGANDGTVNGTTAAMAFNRYSNWGNEACGDGSTGGLRSGDWCFFYPETATQYASEGTWVTVPYGYVRAPQLSPNGGTFIGESVTVAPTSVTDSANFYYTTDDNDPTSSGTRTFVAKDGTITVGTGLDNGASITLKVVAYYYGYFSEVTTATYQKVSALTAPQPDVPEGNYVDNFTLHLTGTAGATIYYTKGGTGLELPADPTSSSTEYTSSGISIASDTLGTVTTIKAIAIAGSISSPVVTLTYTKAEGVTVSGTATSWDNTDNTVYRLYASTVADADIKADIKLASPTQGTAATSKGTPAASGSQYAQTYRFTAITNGSYKLAIYKPGGYVLSLTQITVASSDLTQDVTLGLLGDVSGDGYVNGADIAKIRDYILKRATFSAQEQVFGDVTGDGYVNGADIAKIRDYILKRISNF